MFYLRKFSFLKVFAIAIMARGAGLSTDMKARISELRSLHWSPNRIHKKHPEIKLSTIKSFIQREARQAQNHTPSRPGPKRKLSEEDRDHIYDIVHHQNPHIKHRDLLREVDNKIKLSSLRNLLREMGKRKWLQKRRPMLTADHARQRLRWARRNRKWTAIWWRQIRWSDECSVERGAGIQPVWTFTRPGNQAQLGDVKEVRTGKGVKKMLWASFCYKDRTGLVPLDGDEESKRKGITGRVIRALYEAFLPDFVTRDGIFMHDNARVHTAKIVTRLLQEKGLRVIKWPPYSPDLNPIENLWAIMKKEIYRLYPWLEHAPDTEETLRALIEAAKEAWHAIPQQILRNLSDSMPRRVKDIIKAEGWYTDR
jgi:transposase